MNFGPEGEDKYRETGKGYGMLGVGTGKVKLQVKDNKVSLSKKQKKGLARHMGGGGAGSCWRNDIKYCTWSNARNRAGESRSD